MADDTAVAPTPRHPPRVRVRGPAAAAGSLLFPSFETGQEAMVTDVRKLLDRVAVRAGFLTPVIDPKTGKQSRKRSGERLGGQVHPDSDLPAHLESRDDKDFEDRSGPGRLLRSNSSQPRSGRTLGTRPRIPGPGARPTGAPPSEAGARAPHSPPHQRPVAKTETIHCGARSFFPMNRGSVCASVIATAADRRVSQHLGKNGSANGAKPRSGASHLWRTVFSVCRRTAQRWLAPDTLRRQALYPTELRTPSERLKLARGGWAPTIETALSSERRW
jgi:hypothetical protein